MNFELIVYDFDGVMTDNKVYVDASGIESVRCDRRDGFAINRFRGMGFEQIILTEESNQVVACRAKKLGIDCYVGIRDKDRFLVKYCATHSIDLKKVVYVGDGLNDLKIMKRIGNAFCPNDACVEVFAVAQSLSVNGGDGVVLNLWEYLTKNFR